MLFETLLFLWGIGIWSPGLQSVSGDFTFENITPIEKKWVFTPEIDAKSILVLDKNSASILYEKNSLERLPMASLTKMMTALIITENHQLNEVVEISRGSSFTEGSSMKLHKGEKISVQNLLTGLMLPSGNDAAIALSEYDAKTVYAFVDTMNMRAKQLRLKNTHFSNPHGFDSPYHYSSAFDLALLAKKILQNDFLRNIVSLPSATVLSVDGEVVHELHNTNTLLGTVYPVYGIKTGTTPNAGECLALYVKKNNREYIIIILGSQDRYLDAKVLLWRLML